MKLSADADRETLLQQSVLQCFCATLRLLARNVGAGVGAPHLCKNDSASGQSYDALDPLFVGPGLFGQECGVGRYPIQNAQFKRFFDFIKVGSIQEEFHSDHLSISDFCGKFLGTRNLK